MTMKKHTRILTSEPPVWAGPNKPTLREGDRTPTTYHQLAQGEDDEDAGYSPRRYASGHDQESVHRHWGASQPRGPQWSRDLAMIEKEQPLGVSVNALPDMRRYSGNDAGAGVGVAIAKRVDFLGALISSAIIESVGVVPDTESQAGGLLPPVTTTGEGVIHHPPAPVVVPPSASADGAKGVTPHVGSSPRMLRRF